MCALSLGIDTSNYTTSVALVDENLNLLYNKGILLNVKPGEKGLRQSDALFQHVGNLPEVLKGITINDSIEVVCCSDRPRPLEDSYMPVFRAGCSLAESLSILTNAFLLKISHQENHIRAAIFGSGEILDDEQFCAVHFSGGTSEILWVEKKPPGFDCKIIAKTLDLNAGQLIDRIGVLLGLQFPAGRKLEELARKSNERKKGILTSALANADFHFSGQENQAKLALEKGVPEEVVALEVFETIAKTLADSLRKLGKEKPFKSVVFSGGVMSNTIIKKRLEKELGDLNLYFSPGEYARDNATGNALLGMEHYKRLNSR